jgi:hypothetical protein
MELKILQDIDFVEKLEKNEIYKKSSGTTLDPNEIRIGLQIVPKTVMKFLVLNVSPMEIDSGKDFSLDTISGQGYVLSVTKHGHDVYSGNINKEGKVVMTFDYRSLPGVGIVIMSTFELYDLDNLDIAKVTPADDEAFRNKSTLLDEMIDEKLRLMSLVEAVVEKKMAQRDAIEQLFAAKLTQAIKTPEVKVEPIVQSPLPEIVKKENLVKSTKLKDFLDKRKKKKEQKFVFKMEKAEATCPHCKESLFTEGCFSGCVCLGEDQQNQVLVAKSENGIQFSFHRSWDVENVQMVLEAIKNKIK